ncbi:MAG: Uma2 family endonuclease [Pseudomonadota bacterium]
MAKPLPEPQVPTGTMTVAEFLAWADAQQEGRFELVDGRIVAMSPERVLHADTKFNAAVNLRDALEKISSPCRVYIDGAGIEIPGGQIRVPDVAIQCTPPDPQSQLLDAPVVVVEVVSPTSARRDTIAKVSDYMSVPTIRHYLIVDPEERMVVRHSRDEGATAISTEIHRDGTILLAPPGIEIQLEDFAGSARAPDEQGE